ncbi:MAG: hypothetical protein WB930_20045 [Syntrophobacteraceae bacterium]
MENKDIYKVALDTRNVEISLFWQRSNYFLVLNSALALGFFNLKMPLYALFLAVFGFLASWLWYRVNLGSKYWQSRWEYRLRETEKKIDPNLKFFYVDDRRIFDSDVEASMKFYEHKALQLWLDRQILKKPSVTYNMILLSIMFQLGWSILFVVKLLNFIFPLSQWCH